MVRGVAQSNKVAVADVLAMRSTEYPKKPTRKEARSYGVHQATVDVRVGLAQIELAKKVQRKRKRRAPHANRGGLWWRRSRGVSTSAASGFRRNQ